MRKKYFGIYVLCILGGILLFIGVLVFVNWLGTSETTIVEGADKYKGRSAYFEVEAEDYCSHLLVFPEKKPQGMSVEKYYYEYCPYPFSSSYKIYLQYIMDEAGYEAEKLRIENISMHYKGFEQKVFKTEEFAPYNVYITAWIDDGHGCEYALLDDENRRIICVYSQLESPESNLVPSEYLLKSDDVKELVGEKFSIYYFEDEDGAMRLPDLYENKIKATWYPNN